MERQDRKQILVIEDDCALQNLVVAQIERFGFECMGANSIAAAKRLLKSGFMPVVTLLDVRLPDGTGLDFLPQLTDLCSVIVVTAHGSIDQAVEAIQAGAADYLVKPASPQSIEIAINRCLKTNALQEELAYWQDQAKRGQDVNILGTSSAVREIKRLIDLFSKADLPVLIEGEGGLGKELIGRLIHESSSRGNRRFVELECKALEEQLFAIELFGQETSAFSKRGQLGKGQLELAEGGTIFLNGIEQLSLAMQTKILRVMESGWFRRIGGTKDHYTDVRIIVATQNSLEKECEQGKFSRDLYYRLIGLTIKLPALRDRPEDIASIASYFLETRQFAQDVRKNLSDTALEVMKEYHWPGNIRELRNIIERGIILSGQGDKILPSHLGLSVRKASAIEHKEEGVCLEFDSQPSLEELSNSYMSYLLEKNDGNRSKVAKILNISERNVYRKLKALGSLDK